MQTIHRVGGKTVMWRLLAPLCIASGLGLLWVGWYFLTMHSYVEGGPLAPLIMRIPVGSLFLAAGVGITGGSFIYGPCYVSRIEVDREAGLVRFSVTGFVRGWSLTVRPEDIVSARFHDGYSDSGNAPWTTVRLRGRRLPLIVDDLPIFADLEAVERLLTYQSLAEPVKNRPAPPVEIKRKVSKKKRR